MLSITYFRFGRRPYNVPLYMTSIDWNVPLLQAYTRRYVRFWGALGQEQDTISSLTCQTCNVSDEPHIRKNVIGKAWAEKELWLLSERCICCLVRLKLGASYYYIAGFRALLRTGRPIWRIASLSDSDDGPSVRGLSKLCHLLPDLSRPDKGSLEVPTHL